MSKAIVQREVDICDFCHTNESMHKCLACGKDICWKCAETRSVRYQSHLIFSTSDDGFYCIECDDALAGDALHKAYVSIREYRDIWNRQYDEHQRHSEFLVASIKRLRISRGIDKE